MKKFIKTNIKVVIALVCGLILAGGTATVIAVSIASSNVTYSENSQSTVEGALNDLYTKANTWIDSDYVDLMTSKTNSAATVYASSKGVCFYRNNKLNCLKTNNWSEEQTHIQQVFSDISCEVFSSALLCNASDFYVLVKLDGTVLCSDNTDDSYCQVGYDGSVICE